MLAGHIDDDGVPGALLRLNDVQLGAAIRVTTVSGRVAGYTVIRRQVLPQHELAYSGLLSQQDAPSLVLVSCGGAYDEPPTFTWTTPSSLPPRSGEADE